MTTITPFTPTSQGPFRFSPVLDGLAYNAAITWNVFGQRWYFNLYDQGGALIVTLPLIGSPPGADISLVAGYFASTLVYREATRQFEVTSQSGPTPAQPLPSPMPGFLTPVTPAQPTPPTQIVLNSAPVSVQDLAATIAALPTTLPSIPGQLWLNGGVVQVS